MDENTENIEYTEDPLEIEETERRKRLIAIIGNVMRGLNVLIITTIVGCTIYMVIRNQRQEDVVLPLERQPIFDKSAREDYKNGYISKETACLRIKEHLEQLEAGGHIKSWEADDMLTKFLVTLNDGTRISYEVR